MGRHLAIRQPRPSVIVPLYNRTPFSSSQGEGEREDPCPSRGFSLSSSTLTRTQINEITREEEEEEGFHPSSGMTLAESFCPRARGTERDSESLKLCLKRDSKGRKIYSKKRAIFFSFSRRSELKLEIE